MAAPTQVKAPKEGFWGRVNPFARKKWVNNRVDPLKGQLNELDEVNARNARDIQDLDSQVAGGHPPGPVHAPTKPISWLPTQATRRKMPIPRRRARPAMWTG